jgi:glyoxylase-like metal-dependent hydrolase (beta-lactamase superfamily II)
MNNLNRFGQVPILKKVTEDIKLLSFPYSFGMIQVNCFLFRGERGYTVVDTGSDSEEGINTWEYLMAAGITIEKIVLTHFHIDHLGLAKWFQEKHHIPVFISSKGYQEIQRRQDKDHINYVINLFEQHGCSEFSKMASADFTQAYDFVPDGLFEENQQVQLGNDIYETIWTPGHSADHFCFYQPEQQIMVMGDHVLEKISPVVLIESPYDLNPLQDYFNSMDKIKDYSIKIALPGHGKVMEGLGNRLEEIKSGHIHRMNQIVESVKDEEKTAWQICQETYRNVSFFSPLMATITRCIYLESIGKIKSNIKNGIIYYQSIGK